MSYDETALRPRRKKSRKGLIAFIAFLLILALAGAALVWWGTHKEPEITYDGEPPSQEEIDDMDPQPTDGRFVAPSVGLDAPLGEISIPGSNVINPPDFKHVFLFREYGDVDDDDSGTVYAATHSLKGSDSPGNYLIDIDDAEPTLHADDEIEVDGQGYTVVESKKLSKTELPGDADVWNTKVDNRLVLITCLQRTAGKSVDNVVTTAVKDGHTLEDPEGE